MQLQYFVVEPRPPHWREKDLGETGADTTGALCWQRLRQGLKSVAASHVLLKSPRADRNAGN